MNPFAILFALFLIIPIIEIYLLIAVGQIIGTLPTVSMVVFTAVLGVWLLRIQGFATLRNVQNTMAKGGIPAIEMLEGAILLVAGALLLTPGFFTDSIGFLCLVPPLRHAIALLLFRRLFHIPPSNSNDNDDFPSSRPHHSHRPNVIEGEFRRDDE